MYTRWKKTRITYPDLPRRRLHSPRTDRTIEKSPVMPAAMSVQTQKNIPLLPAILPPTSPAPRMWASGMSDASSDPRRMMMYPDRRPDSTCNHYVTHNKLLAFSC